MQILSLPPVTNSYPSSVNKSDKNLAAAAALYDCVILTDDHVLAMELSRDGLRSISSLQATMKFKSLSPTEPPLYEAPPLNASSIRQHSWHCFVRVVPGTWANGGRHNSCHTVFDLEGRVKVYFDNHRHRWCALVEDGTRLHIDQKASSGVPTCIAWTYSFSANLGVSMSTLMSHSAGSAPQRHEKKLSPNVVLAKPKKINFGHDRENLSHWNGHILQYSHNFGRISFETFRAVSLTPDAIPSLTSAMRYVAQCS